MNARLRYESEIIQLTLKRDQSIVKRQEYTFSAMNTQEQYYQAIDLHGQDQRGAWNITNQRLKETKQALTEGTIKPNYSGSDHIFKVITGAGKHAANGIGVLKYAVKELLDEMKCDYYSDMEHGVFLVRIKVTQ